MLLWDRTVQGTLVLPQLPQVATTEQQGISLIEVLVALLLLAIGVLGAIMLQTSALRYSVSAADRTQASYIVNDLLDRMRANPSELPNYATQVAAGCTPPVQPASILEVDLADFRYAVSCLLPAGRARVEIHGQRATIHLVWSDERVVAGAGDNSLTVTSLIGGMP